MSAFDYTPGIAGQYRPMDTRELNNALAAQVRRVKELEAALREIADLSSDRQDECGATARRALDSKVSALPTSDESAALNKVE